MKSIYLLILLAFTNTLSITDFENAIENLANLEKYIKEYIKEKAPSQTLTHLITCYIRKEAYNGTERIIEGGIIPDDLSQYIIDKDTSEGTNAQECQKIREIELPNNEKFDFVHFFAVMNGIEFGNSYSAAVAHLVGWGEDTLQLFWDIKNEQGNLEELMIVAKNYFMVKGAVFVSALDAPILLKKKMIIIILLKLLIIIIIVQNI